jgi:hypothetical protein
VEKLKEFQEKLIKTAQQKTTVQDAKVKKTSERANGAVKSSKVDDLVLSFRHG